ncbi:hypothetical protein [Bacillus sp. SD075]|nr:hypothetical protein [Bacillus sp. SD075]
MLQSPRIYQVKGEYLPRTIAIFGKSKQIHESWKRLRQRNRLI